MKLCAVRLGGSLALKLTVCYLESALVVYLACTSSRAENCVMRDHQSISSCTGNTVHTYLQVSGFPCAS